jgi:hypothetical protein
MWKRTSSALAVLLFSGAALANPPPGWLAGCWTGQDSSAAQGAFEAWSAPRAGQMLGVSQTVRTTSSGTRREFEYLRIEVSAADLKVVPQPNGKPPVEFVAIASEASRLLFHNPAHDFPKYIDYARDGDTLTVRIGDAAPGEDGRRLSFVFKRTACEPIFAKP